VSYVGCHKSSSGNVSIMEDANKATRSYESDLIQETGQEVRPARMVGYSSLDSTARSSMEAGYDDRASCLWRGGEG
jgi:hypothetical protein